MKKIILLFLTIVVCELVGINSSFFTIEAIPTWYETLQKPFFSPPNWIFGPVWTLLYFLMGISFYLILQQKKSKKRTKVLQLFVLQLFFNFIWSLLFFGLHNILLGLIDITILVITIFVTMKAVYPLSKPAMYLLIPYILWVSFATILNLSFLLLNY